MNQIKRKMARESDSSQDIQKTEKVIFWDEFCGYGKNVIFTSHGCLFTFSGRNDLAEVKRTKKNSNGAIVYDDDAHIVVLCTRSHFLSTRWVLLRSKEKTLKIQV